MKKQITSLHLKLQTRNTIYLLDSKNFMPNLFHFIEDQFQLNFQAIESLSYSNGMFLLIIFIFIFIFLLFIENKKFYNF